MNYKKFMAALLAGVLCASMAGCGQSQGKASNAMVSRGMTFWYDDDSYAEYFEAAAAEYEEETGVKVTTKYIESIDYIGEIYDETMQDGSFPDVYLIQGDNLAQAYLYGLVAVNEDGFADGTAEHAMEASKYSDTSYGYPLSFNTCVFVCQNGFFESAPETIDSIITYSKENDPPEDVEYLLEWDANDPFYDFPFVGNSVTFVNDSEADVSVEYDTDLYAKDLEYFEEILEYFSIDADTVSESSISSSFRTGHTLCAIVDTDMLEGFDEVDYSLMQIPDLNDELKSVTTASTDLILVNDFAADTDTAADFARFVTADYADKLMEMTGHYSVISSDALGGEMTEAEVIVREAYENAVLMPDARDAKDFWVNLKETILKYF